VKILVCAAAVCFPLYATYADTTDLDDAAARLQYAFYTEDVRGIEDVLALLPGVKAAEPGMTQYYSAYGNWKLSQLYAALPANDKAVGKAAQDCERQARAAIAADSRMAEAYAIQAICSATTAMLSGGDCSRSKSLHSALELDPRNPRIRLIELLCTKDGANSAAELLKLRGLVAAFESAAPSRPGKPDWGHAETLVMLAQSYLQHGDSVAARDTVERALVLAPDYRKAQALLQAAATRPK
jgi:hypothetical protein